MSEQREPVVVEYVPQQEEIADCIALVQSKTGHGKRIFQLVLAIVLFVVSTVSFIIYRNTIELVVAIICLIIIPTITIVPRMLFRMGAKSFCEQCKQMRIEIGTETIKISQDGMESEVEIRDIKQVVEDAACYAVDIGRDRVLCIPKRALGEKDPAALEKTFSEALGEKFYPAK